MSSYSWDVNLTPFHNCRSNNLLHIQAGKPSPQKASAASIRFQETEPSPKHFFSDDQPFSQSTHTSHTTTGMQCSLYEAIIFSYIVGSHQSSLSTKPIKSPEATSRPALRASPKPPFFLWITFMRESFFAHTSHISGLLSGEPSSTRMISKFLYVCEAILSTQRSRKRSTLYTGTITDIFKSSVILPSTCRKY